MCLPSGFIYFLCYAIGFYYLYAAAIAVFEERSFNPKQPRGVFWNKEIQWTYRAEAPIKFLFEAGGSLFCAIFLFTLPVLFSHRTIVHLKGISQSKFMACAIVAIAAGYFLCMALIEIIMRAKKGQTPNN